MQHIKINSEAFKKQCQFIKENTNCTTLASTVREAVRIAYLKVKEDKKTELEKQLKELKK